jgi:hypothetical protein
LSDQRHQHFSTVFRFNAKSLSLNGCIAFDGVIWIWTWTDVWGEIFALVGCVCPCNVGENFSSEVEGVEEEDYALEVVLEHVEQVLLQQLFPVHQSDLHPYV